MRRLTGADIVELQAVLRAVHSAVEYEMWNGSMIGYESCTLQVRRDFPDVDAEQIRELVIQDINWNLRDGNVEAARMERKIYGLVTELGRSTMTELVLCRGWLNESARGGLIKALVELRNNCTKLENKLRSRMPVRLEGNFVRKKTARTIRRR